MKYDKATLLNPDSKLENGTPAYYLVIQTDAKACDKIFR